MSKQIAQCSQCGNEFESYRSAHRSYCSHSCYLKARFGKLGIRKCVVCQKKVRGSRIRCCSTKCRSVFDTGRPRPWNLRREKRICLICSTQFEIGGRVSHWDKKFCSQQCSGVASRKALEGSIVNRGRCKTAWGEKRDSILARDGGRCRVCKHTQNLQVHHVIPQTVRLDHGDENLISACRRCHQTLDAITRLGYECVPDFDPWEHLKQFIKPLG